MIPRTKREYWRELVADKNRWSRRLTGEERAVGFLGWRERGYLPHCDFPGHRRAGSESGGPNASLGTRVLGHFMRNEKEAVAIRYIENNPVKTINCVVGRNLGNSAAQDIAMSVGD